MPSGLARKWRKTGGRGGSVACHEGVLPARAGMVAQQPLKRQQPVLPAPYGGGSSGECGPAAAIRSSAVAIALSRASWSPSVLSTARMPYAASVARCAAPTTDPSKSPGS